MKTLKLSILIILSVFLSSCTESISETKPNVIIILTDDQGWGDLSSSGNTNLSTPNIDELAETGISFDRFYVSPYCSATRAEMLTGRYYVRGGVSSATSGRERLDLDETTISRVFKDAGYATAAYGKWHNGMQPPYHPNARGFDDYYGFCSGHWGNYYDPMLEHNGEIVQGEGYIIDDFTDHGLAFMEENKDHPFFLYLPYNTPHGPFQVPDRWWNKFENMDPAMVHREPGKENVQFTRAALAMCENIDWNVGRITDKLEELGLSENTIILYLSDNGPASYRWNGDMKGKKGDTDEGGVRSPFFIKWAGKFEAGKTVPQIAGAMDLLPTLSDLAGIDYEPQKALDGVSLKALMLEKNPEWEERLIFNHCNGRTSVRSQLYRLGHEGQLFDMVKDPEQYTDISDQEPEIKEELTLAKKKWEREVLSELPEKDTRNFTIGHPDFSFTQVPARDGTAFGNIKRSSKHANCSFFTNWTSLGDSITWEAEVLESGEYEVALYYTCPAGDVGSVFELSLAGSKLRGKITEAHDPPLTGMEHDRAPRGGSFVKDFKRMPLGSIHLEKGEGVLTLKALEIPGLQVMDFRLLMLKRTQKISSADTTI